MNLRQQIDTAKAALQAAEADSTAARANQKQVEKKREASVAHLVTASEETWEKVSLIESKAFKLRQELDDISMAIGKGRDAFAEEVGDAVRAFKQAFDAETRARRQLSLVYFELAQAELTESTTIHPSTFWSELKNVIKSRREFKLNHSLASAVKQELEKSQGEGGLQQYHLNYVRTRDVNGNRVELTDLQIGRVWAYLQESCILREDGGLAPPYEVQED